MLKMGKGSFSEVQNSKITPGMFISSINTGDEKVPEQAQNMVDRIFKRTKTTEELMAPGNINLNP